MRSVQMKIAPDVQLNIEAKLAEEERKALESLARYKFLMAGYHAAVWLHLSRLDGVKRPNPFREFVKLARSKLAESCKDSGQKSWPNNGGSI
jgi:hypothetical protein